MLPSNRKYYDEYSKSLGIDLESVINELKTNSTEFDLGYRIQASAVFSSNIEGNSIDLNSYMNSLMSKRKFKPEKELSEIDDLVAAYQFVNANELTEKNFLKCHKLLSQNLLIASKQGRYRDDKMGVFDTDGLVYLAVEPEFVAKKMSEFFEDITDLLAKEMSIQETFYHASLIHLVFVHIHPFFDGNGRAARLLEKWFLAQKLGELMWGVQSEKHYKEHQSEYYININLGVNYYELNYDKCLPFLNMLIDSVDSPESQKKKREIHLEKLARQAQDLNLGYDKP